MRASSLVFISLLVFAAIAEDNDPGIPIKWKPSAWTQAEVGTMFEPALTTNSIQRYKSHQTIMMEGESPIPNSGDLCVDFARQMVPHHWGAIAMSMDNVNIANWNSDITPIGKNIATTQAAQLDQFINWLEKKGIPWMGDDFWTWEANKGKSTAKWSKNIPNSEFADYVSKMHSGMTGTTLTGELNFDLARQMIPHHWAAIEMAEDVLEDGNCDAEMIAIAKNVKATQSHQVKQFRAWLIKIGWEWKGEDWEANPLSSKTLRGTNWQAIDSVSQSESGEAY